MEDEVWNLGFAHDILETCPSIEILAAIQS